MREIEILGTIKFYGIVIHNYYNPFKFQNYIFIIVKSVLIITQRKVKCEMSITSFTKGNRNNVTACALPVHCLLTPLSQWRIQHGGLYKYNNQAQISSGFRSCFVLISASLSNILLRTLVLIVVKTNSNNNDITYYFSLTFHYLIGFIFNQPIDLTDVHKN